jgi:hypothetical protein
MVQQLEQAMIEGLHFGKGVVPIDIVAYPAHRPPAERLHEQNHAACDVMMGPACSSYIGGFSLAGVKEVRIGMVSCKHIQAVMLCSGAS